MKNQKGSARPIGAQYNAPMRLFRPKRTYLDYASAPPVHEDALSAMRAAESLVGNAGAIHKEALAALAALDDARARVAKLLEVKSRELVFTSGLTESNNIAILGFARALEMRRRSLAGTEWIVSAIEHASVLDCFGEVERMGGTVSHVMPNERGIISPEAVQALLKRETVFVSIGWGNNEIGTIQLLGKIARVLEAHEKKYGTVVLLHSDAGQAPLYEPTTAHTLGVDLLSLGSNKLYGPHGVGGLYLSNRSDIARIMQGGPQERGLRAGTENVALAAGFAAAFEAVASVRERESKRLRDLRDEFARTLLQKIPPLVVNGDLRESLPHMLNVSIPDINSEYVVLRLDHEGIACSTKSACREGEEQESHVVLALGGPPWRSQNTLRFSLGRDTTRNALNTVSEKLVCIIDKEMP